MVPPPETMERLINAAADVLLQDTIKALTRGSVLASVEGQEHAATTLGIPLNFNLVNSYAVRKAIDYRDLLVKKGGSMIGGEFKPWLKDAVEVDRQAVSDIVTAAISKEGGTTLPAIRKELDVVFTAGEHNSALVAYQETRRQLVGGTFDRWDEEGIETGTWRHLAGQLDPRPEHEERDGRSYPLADPIWDDLYLWNCHCTCEPDIPVAGGSA
jgi:hypothetical protein